MKSKILFSGYGLFLFLLIFAHDAIAQDNSPLTTQVYYKSERGPYWTKTQLDSFLISKENNRYKIVARKTKTEKRNDSLINFVNLRMDPVAVDNNNKPWEGQKLPPFNLKGIDGKTIDSKDLLGKPLVVNLWFTTCRPCIEEMPDLNRLQKKYEDSNVVFVAITFDKKLSIINFLKKHNFNFTIIPEAKSYCDFITQLYPVTFFVDRKGIIRYAEHVLPFSFDTLNLNLRSVLENNF